jgi:heterodisulfide reductase subunit A-like polyferredoxin
MPLRVCCILLALAAAAAAPPPPSPPDADIIVIGGGISGLFAALELQSYSNLSVLVRSP